MPNFLTEQTVSFLQTRLHFPQVYFVKFEDVRHDFVFSPCT